MKKHLFVIVMASLALAACQDDKAPATPTPAEPTAASVTHPASTPAPAAVQKTAEVAAGNAVAVTKPAISHTGQNMQAALRQAGAAVKADVGAMVAQPKIAEKQAVATPQAVPAKEVVANKVTAMAKKAAPVHQTAPVAKVVPKQAPKTTPKAVASSLPVIPAVESAMAGDAGRGQSLARKCKTCHNFTAKKKVGPGLKGVFGRKAGVMPDMKYSSALAAGGWVWNEKNLAIWLCDSKKAVKILSGNASAKTKMSPQRICDAGKQADLIAFLKTL